MQTKQVRASVGATVVLSLVAVATVLLGSSPASATPSLFELGVVTIGTITVEYDESGPQVELTLETVTEGWLITGGEEPVPAADIAFHINLFTLSHMELLLVQVFLYDTDGCVVGFHGPLLLGSGTGTQYHGNFSKGNLGGILYSAECGDLADLILFTLLFGNVLVLFHTS